jgi:hypothetical protein
VWELASVRVLAPVLARESVPVLAPVLGRESARESGRVLVRVRELALEPVSEPVWALVLALASVPV